MWYHTTYWHNRPRCSWPLIKLWTGTDIIGPLFQPFFFFLPNSAPSLILTWAENLASSNLQDEATEWYHCCLAGRPTQSVANIFFLDWIRIYSKCSFNTNTNIFGFTFWTEYEYEYICNNQVDKIRIFKYFGLKYSNIIWPIFEYYLTNIQIFHLMLL